MNTPQNPLTPGPVALTVVTANLTPPRRALAVGAHPDDVDFGCGATLAKWAAAGCEVHVLVCTDGSKGTWDPEADEAELVATRRREQAEAARRLGATGSVRFLDRVDGELTSDLATRAEVARVIRQVRPDVLLGHDPWKRYRLHPDHRHAGLLVTEGLVAARDPKFFPDQLGPDGLTPHRPDRLLLWEADEPDHLEDVGAHVDTKIEALLAHHSQFRSTMAADDDPDLTRFRERVRAKAAEAGRAAGVAQAEVFKLIDDL